MTDEEVLAAVRSRILAGHPTDLNRRSLPPAPASEADVDEAERIIGYPLPPLLRRLYQEVANGGFGPFGGIEGLRGGYRSDDPGMLDVYVQYADAELDSDTSPPPPYGVVFFCDFGCAMWALLDCRHPEGQMWWWEEGERHKLELTLTEWFSMWLAGQLDHAAMDALKLQDESWCWPERG